MHVLLTTPQTDRPGGVANYYLTLRSYLPDNIEYFTVGSRSGDEGVWKVFKRFLKDYHDFYRLLRQGTYDLVHLNPSLGSRAVIRDGIFLLIAKALKLKVVVFMRGWDAGFERKIRKYYMPLFRYVFLKADAFIVLGSEFRDKLNDIGYAKQVFLETTVVDNAIISSAASRIQQVASDSDETGINILMLTRIVKTKGVYEGVDAYQIIKSKYPSVTLTIAGCGSELEALEKYTHDKGITDVDFPGFVAGEEKRSTFERASIYLSPTYSEGMPNAMLEAMACGLSIVTRPVGGIRDFFENGRMGFVTESLEPDEFAKLLEKLVVDSDMRVKIGAFNCNYAKKHFMASSVAERLQTIYRKVLTSAPPG